MLIKYIISGVVALILSILLIINGLFDGWTFFGIIFYLLVYIGGYAYVKIGMKNRDSNYDEILQRRLKFDWCWERINQILKSMPGGQGIEWASGVGRKSSIKSYFDGVQNKPFRSVLAHLEDSQQYVMIIYDIEGDDIAEFIANPSTEIIDNPFLNFKPFSRGVSREDGLDRFGNYGYDYRGGLRTSRHRRPSTVINLGRELGRQEDFGDYGEKKLEPDKSVVDNALNKLRRK